MRNFPGHDILPTTNRWHHKTRAQRLLPTMLSWRIVLRIICCNKSVSNRLYGAFFTPAILKCPCALRVWTKHRNSVLDWRTHSNQHFEEMPAKKKNPHIYDLKGFQGFWNFEKTAAWKTTFWICKIIQSSLAEVVMNIIYHTYFWRPFSAQILPMSPGHAHASPWLLPLRIRDL